MKFLRVTVFDRTDLNEDCSELVGIPATAITAVDQLAVPIEEYRRMARKPGQFVVIDEFEHDGSLNEAIPVGMRRMEDSAADELNQAIGYHWNGQVLSHARQMLANPGPSPLSVEQTREMLDQLANHPNYHGQTVQCYVWKPGARTNAALVEMKDGAVTVMRGVSL